MNERTADMMREIARALGRHAAACESLPRDSVADSMREAYKRAARAVRAAAKEAPQQSYSVRVTGPQSILVHVEAADDWRHACEVAVEELDGVTDGEQYTCTTSEGTAIVRVTVGTAACALT